MTLVHAADIFIYELVKKATVYLSEVSPDEKPTLPRKHWNIDFLKSITSHLVGVSKPLLIGWNKSLV